MIRRPPRSTLFPTRRSSDLSCSPSTRVTCCSAPNGPAPSCGRPRSPPSCPRVSLLVLTRSEEHTSELQSRPHLVCRLLLEKKKTKHQAFTNTVDPSLRPTTP